MARATIAAASGEASHPRTPMAARLTNGYLLPQGSGGSPAALIPRLGRFLPTGSMKHKQHSLFAARVAWSLSPASRTFAARTALSNSIATP